MTPEPSVVVVAPETSTTSVQSQPVHAVEAPGLISEVTATEECAVLAQDVGALDLNAEASTTAAADSPPEKLT